MKKVILVLPTFAVGGVERQVAQIVSALSGIFEFYIISINRHLECREFINEPNKVSIISLGKEATGFNLYWYRLTRLFKNIKPDVVVTFEWPGGVEALPSAMLCRIKNIVHFERGMFKDEIDRRKWRRVWFRRMTLPFISRVVVVSDHLKTLAHAEWWVPKDKIVRLYNGVDTKKFYPYRNELLRKAHGFSDNDILIGTVANLTGIKNQKYLIEIFGDVFKSHPQVRLVICGEGPEKQNLLDAVRSGGLDKAVLFTGGVKDPSSIYQMFDIFALTSLSEQMPNCVLEAMASGLPVLSTDVGDIKRMVAVENNRLMYTVDDLMGIVAGAEELVKNNLLRKTLGRVNRARAEAEYPMDKTVEAYRKLFIGE